MLPIELDTLVSIAGYPGIFAIIFAESGLIFAFFLPGASLLFTTGFLASQGILNIWILIPLVALAATLGDNVGYWFGAKIGVHLFDRPDSRFFKKAYLDKTRRFYARYGSRTVLLARFVPIVRTFAPVLAGVAGMHYPTFMLYNVIGAILWGSGITALGYTLGAAFPQTADHIELIVLGIIVITLIPLVREILRTREASLQVRGAIFDLDGTLAAPFADVGDVARDHLVTLSRLMPIAIVSGATFERIERTVLKRIPEERYDAITVLSENGGEAYVWEGSWRKRFAESIDDTEFATITAAIESVSPQFPEFTRPAQGERIIRRNAFIAYAVLGTDAPRAEKDAWDPTGLKRGDFIKSLKKVLPGYDIFLGGMTTIDIMRKGVNKAHGVRWLLEHWKLRAADVLFVGDALYEGGNDFPVISTGVETRQVQSPQETVELIDKLIKESDSNASRI